MRERERERERGSYLGFTPPSYNHYLLVSFICDFMMSGVGAVVVGLVHLRSSGQQQLRHALVFTPAALEEGIGAVVAGLVHVRSLVDQPLDGGDGVLRKGVVT